MTHTDTSNGCAGSCGISAPVVDSTPAETFYFRMLLVLFGLCFFAAMVGEYHKQAYDREHVRFRESLTENAGLLERNQSANAEIKRLQARERDLEAQLFLGQPPEQPNGEAL